MRDRWRWDRSTCPNLVDRSQPATEGVYVACSCDAALPAGSRVILLHNGWTGTVLAHTRTGDERTFMVRWDSRPMGVGSEYPDIGGVVSARVSIESISPCGGSDRK